MNLCDTRTNLICYIMVCYRIEYFFVRGDHAEPEDRYIQSFCIFLKNELPSRLP